MHAISTAANLRGKGKEGGGEQEVGAVPPYFIQLVPCAPTPLAIPAVED